MHSETSPGHPHQEPTNLYPTVSTQPSHISVVHHHSSSSSSSDGDGNDRGLTSIEATASAEASSNAGPSRLHRSHSTRSRNQSRSTHHLNQDELEEAADSDSASEYDTFLRQGRIDVGQTWDDSSEEEETEDAIGDRTLPLSTSVQDRRKSPAARRKIKLKRASPESYLQSLRPSREHRRAWWKFLTNPGTPASLSAPHVSANLFSASLHPAVLLSMPHYFARTGVPLGTVALVGVAILGGVGGGLWVVLSRYVNGNSIEAIVGASFGRYTKWKGGLGRALSGLLIALYATGAAIIGYFALADLLLQVFFNYSPRGVPLHDRAFITLVVGGLISVPLVIFPLAKRNVIRLNTFFSVIFYPIIATIILVKIYAISPPVSTLIASEDLAVRHIGSGLGGKWPNANPSKPPSIWAPISLLPLLTLSACPLQILAHQRSLRRIGTSRSNVKAFLGAQAGQVIFIIIFGLIFGVAAGTNGVQKRLGKDVHPNLFASLPNDDDTINVARLMFVAILATHLAICLTTARSSWGRLLRLLNINPLRKKKAPIHLATEETTSTVGGGVAHGRVESTLGKWKRQWGKPARNALAGVLLWGTTATSAYLSGAGGFRRSEKDGEEARFTRASEVLGLMGAGVGFVLPGLVWTILFHIRRPRAILPPFASELGKSASAYFIGPQSLLARNRRYLFGTRRVADEREPLLANHTRAEVEAEEEQAGPSGNVSPRQSSRASFGTRHSSSLDLGEAGGSIPSHLTEQSSDDRDEATTILLARKERQMQRRTRGKRIWQDIVVFAAVLPFGFALLVLGAIELRRGGY